MHSSSIKIPLQELIRELKAGNQLVFQQVFNEYYNALCLEAKGYFRSEALAEEIVCDVFTRIWMNREKLNITSSLRDYLIKSVHNNCIDYYRMQKKQEKINTDWKNVPPDGYSLADMGENPLDYILTREMEDCINRSIEKLPEQCRKTFLLSREQELSYEEIAVQMGISVNSVKTHIKHALSRLRDALKIFLILAALFLLSALS